MDLLWGLRYIQRLLKTKGFMACGNLYGAGAREGLLFINAGGSNELPSSFPANMKDVDPTQGQNLVAVSSPVGPSFVWSYYPE